MLPSWLTEYDEYRANLQVVPAYRFNKKYFPVGCASVTAVITQLVAFTGSGFKTLMHGNDFSGTGLNDSLQRVLVFLVLVRQFKNLFNCLFVRCDEVTASYCSIA